MSREATIRDLRIADGARILSVNGELTGRAVDALRGKLETLAASDSCHVIIDLLDVTFVDAAGLELFMASAGRLAEAGGDLALVSDDPRVLRLLELTGAARSMRVERVLSAAVGGLFDRLYGLT
ncbi:MAG: STAS domain-containing protein [Gaiellaceae bacterium]